MPIRGSKLLGIAGAPTLNAGGLDDQCLTTFEEERAARGSQLEQGFASTDEVRVDPRTAGGGVIGKNNKYLNGRAENHQ